MKRVSYIIAVTSIAVLLTAGCDEGLKPTITVQAGRFAGLITYQNWPPRDSLVDLRLVAFRTFPPRDIVGEVLQGQAFVYPALGDTALVPFFVDSLRYIVTVPSGAYRYVIVAQRFGPDLYRDWRAVGQYVLDVHSTTPSSVNVAPDSTTNDIDINVDFLHPPPPPF